MEQHTTSQQRSTAQQHDVKQQSIPLRYTFTDNEQSMYYKCELARLVEEQRLQKEQQLANAIDVINHSNGEELVKLTNALIAKIKMLGGSHELTQIVVTILKSLQLQDLKEIMEDAYRHYINQVVVNK